MSVRLTIVSLTLLAATAVERQNASLCGLPFPISQGLIHNSGRSSDGVVALYISRQYSQPSVVEQKR